LEPKAKAQATARIASDGHCGAPLVALQRLLGHQALLMTSGYTHLVPTDLRRELLATHPRGIRKKPRKQSP